jgi:hypothetical protein
MKRRLTLTLGFLLTSLIVFGFVPSVEASKEDDAWQRVCEAELKYWFHRCKIDHPISPEPCIKEAQRRFYECMKTGTKLKQPSDVDLSGPLPGDVKKNRCRQVCAVTAQQCHSDCQHIADQGAKNACRVNCEAWETICASSCIDDKGPSARDDYMPPEPTCACVTTRCCSSTGCGKPGCHDTNEGRMDRFTCEKSARLNEQMSSRCGCHVTWECK